MACSRHTCQASRHTLFIQRRKNKRSLRTAWTPGLRQPVALSDPAISSHNNLVSRKQARDTDDPPAVLPFCLLSQHIQQISLTAIALSNSSPASGHERFRASRRNPLPPGPLIIHTVLLRHPVVYPEYLDLEEFGYSPQVPVFAGPSHLQKEQLRMLRAPSSGFSSISSRAPARLGHNLSVPH